MTKRALLDRLIAHLAAEVDAMTKAALATHAEATDEENKAEDKYDTRGLEASYLAHGQSKAAEEAAQALAQFRALSPRDFSASDPIGLGALVILESKSTLSAYFIGPRAGGTELDVETQSVMVVTPQSPLGRQLLGRRQGDVLMIEAGGRRTESRIASVS